MGIGAVETSTYEDLRAAIEPTGLDETSYSQGQLPCSSHEDLGERRQPCLISKVDEDPSGFGSASSAETVRSLERDADLAHAHRVAQLVRVGLRLSCLTTCAATLVGNPNNHADLTNNSWECSQRVAKVGMCDLQAL